MQEPTCPFCGAKRKPRDRFCVQCGSRLGAPATPGPKQPPEQEEGQRFTALRPLLYVLEYFPGLASPKIILLSAIVFAIALGTAASAILALFGALLAAFVIGGFALVLYWTALGWILSGEVVMPWEALAEFDGVRWVIFATLTLLPLTLLFAWLKAHAH